MKQRYRYDAILVLGAGLHKIHYKNRVEKAVSLYNKGYAPYVIFSGRCWGGLKPRPREVEANLMAAYAHQLGLPKKAILREQKSLNTVGNFYFTRRLFLEPLKLHRLLIITHPHHFAKSKYLFQKVMGSKYTATFLADGKQIAHTSTAHHTKMGHLTIRDIRPFFDHIPNGNVAQLRKVIFGYHHYRGYKII